MAMILRLLTRVAAIVVLAFFVSPVAAQNVIHLRIDTITADPGATVDVRVLYTFTSTHSHNIHDFLARFHFDTSKSKLAAYIMDGTASAALCFPPADTIPSHTGLLVIGNGQEIDLTDSVLFKIRMTLDSNADTAWVRWDSSYYHGYALAVFSDGDEGIDSVTQEDGWIRSSRPPESVRSVSNTEAPLRMYPNPARDRVTIEVSGAGDAVIEVYDAVGRLSFDGPLVLGGWQIPSGFPAGAYEVRLNEASRAMQSIGTLIVSPR
jgi:hypothetical protein